MVGGFGLKINLLLGFFVKVNELEVCFRFVFELLLGGI